MAGSLLDVLLPTTCAICGRFGAAVCEPCSASLNFKVRSFQRQELIGLTLASFEGVTRELVHAFKEEGKTAIAQVLATPLALAIEHLLQLVAESEAEFKSGPTLLVPVPSSKQSFAARGFQPTRVLATAGLTAGFRTKRFTSQQVLLRNLLQMNTRGQQVDQAGLNRRARKTNRSHSMTASALGCSPNQSLIVFDDIVTTGSTLLEAQRSLRQAGFHRLYFFTFAETLLKSASAELD